MTKGLSRYYDIGVLNGLALDSCQDKLAHLINIASTLTMECSGFSASFETELSKTMS